MSDAEIFAGFAREHGLNTERIESARQKGVTMTTLVTLVSSGRGATEVDAMLYPVINGELSASDLGTQARTLNDIRFSGR